MSMSYAEMKNTILNEYNANLDTWHRIVGAMFESTNGFTKKANVSVLLWGKKYYITGKLYRITWDNYEWSIEQEVEEQK